MDIDKFNKETYIEALTEAIKLKMIKSHDYNNNINRFDYYTFGKQSAFDDINKKVLRLKSLITNNIKPKNETIEDTLLDIINYSADFYSYLKYLDKTSKS